MGVTGQIETLMAYWEAVEKDTLRTLINWQIQNYSVLYPIALCSAMTSHALYAYSHQLN